MERVFRVDFYPHEWLSLTAHMTPEQRGVFITICALIYAHRGPIKDDMAWIGRMANCSTRLCTSIFDELVEQGDLAVEGGLVRQKRCENELTKKRAHLEVSSKGGSTSAQNRRQNSKNSEIASTDDKSSVSTSSPSLPRKQEVLFSEENNTNPLPPARRPPGYSPEFEIFWRTYPKNTGSKKAAGESYDRVITKGATHDTIRNAAAAFARYCAANGTPLDKTPHGATWLNQHRFETDYDAFLAEGAQPGGGAAGDDRGLQRPAQAGHRGGSSGSDFLAEGRRLVAKYAAQDEARRKADAESPQ